MRCIRLFKDEGGGSRFEEGTLALQGGSNHTSKSAKLPTVETSFAETEPSGEPTWHTAPNRQLVLTLGGTLEFETSQGATFSIGPGDVLLAEDTTGRGHGWRLAGTEPWRRVYVVLDDKAIVPFQASGTQPGP